MSEANNFDQFRQSLLVLAQTPQLIEEATVQKDQDIAAEARRCEDALRQERASSDRQLADARNTAHKAKLLAEAAGMEPHVDTGSAVSESLEEVNQQLELVTARWWNIQLLQTAETDKKQLARSQYVSVAAFYTWLGLGLIAVAVPILSIFFG